MQKNKKKIFYCFRIVNRIKVQNKYMASSTPPATKSTIVNTVDDEKFAQIYTPDEKAVHLLDNERTIMNIKPRLFACAVGIHSYSSGIHRIRIRVHDGQPLLGIRSRSIPPTPDEHRWGGYYTSPSTYGWDIVSGRVLNGEFHGYPLKELKKPAHIYTIILDCNEHRIRIINEDTKEEDEMEVDICNAPFPWCLFVDLPRTRARVSLL
jgi:hypothetical protein